MPGTTTEADEFFDAGRRCLHPDEVAAFVASPEDAAATAAVHEHIATCPVCRAWVSELARASWLEAHPRPVDRPSAPPDDTRYLPLVKLGEGSMGTVWAAYDAMLDREVALKVLDTTRPSSTSAVARLRTEARALAALSHPNVVEILDVEFEGPTPRIAMPVVEGPTLDQWLALTPRTCAEIVAVFEQAGRGLEAAHAAGLVHCDFKPRNAIVGADGRVRVLDFGLAVDSSSGRPRWAGTPAYMSPEQRNGDSATPASDQFSWCVALYEALYGDRPGVRPRRPSAGSAHVVPRRIRRILDRGLRTHPGERWPSMTTLLSAVRRPPARRRPVVAAVALGAALALAGFATQREDSCQATNASTWDATSRARIQRALREGAPTGEPALAVRVDRVLAQRVEQLANATEQLCKTGARMGANTRSQRRQCLDRSAHHLQLAVTALSDGVAPLDAATLVERLPSAASCFEVTGTPSPMSQQEVALDHAIVDVRVRSDAGDHAGALAHAAALQQRIEDTGHDALRSRHAYAFATAHHYAGSDGTAWFETAARLGVRGGDVKVAVLAALQLAGGYSPALAVDFEDSNKWLRRAEALIGQNTLHDFRHELARARGNAADTQGRYDDAIESLKVSVVLAREANAGELVVARNLQDLATAQRHAGQLDAAEETQTLALRMYEDAVGPQHPFSASALGELAQVWQDGGRFGEAAEAYARSLALQEAAVGPDHISVAVVATNLASAHLQLGDPTEAVRLLRRVDSIEREQLAPGRATASTQHALGNAYVLQGNLSAASEAFTTGLEHTESELGRAHPESAIFLSSLASVALDQGNTADAVTFATESRALRQRSFGADDPRLAFEDLVLAGALLEQGQPELALEHAERGAALLEHDPIRPLWLAELVYFRARALADLKRRDLARQAAAESAGLFDAQGDEANAAEIRSWVQALAGPS
ncbi:MAG: protein kinase domain-containing protein [Nannocystales bacterium]